VRPKALTLIGNLSVKEQRHQSSERLNYTDFAFLGQS